MRKIELIYWIWFFTGLSFTLIVYFTIPNETHWIGYYVWFIVGGSIYLITKNPMKKQFQNLTHPSTVFFIPTIGLIAIQAFIAAWAHEEDVLKYLAHDYLIFIPWIITLYFVLKKYRLSKTEILVITGMQGSVIEMIIFTPLGLIILPLTAMFYWLMIMPSIITADIYFAQEKKKTIPAYLVSFLLPIIIVVVFQIIAIILSTYYPNLFSPNDF